MNDAPTTRGRHALLWVLGVGLVFVVVSAMALQMARRRADERWLSVMSQLHDGDLLRGRDSSMPPPTSVPLVTFAPLFWPQAETRGGNVFRGWRQVRLDGLEFGLVVRQERSSFGNSMEARLSGEAGQVATVNAILARIDLELIVEP